MHRIAVLTSYADAPAEEWDALVGDRSPFLEHAYLAGLEAHGCATAATGWAPRPVLVRDAAGALVAAAPAWVKSHSRGEFVYDQGWAEAARRAGYVYFPKLVVAVPFTPVSGARLLSRSDAATAALVAGLEAAGRDTRGVHVLFDTADEAVLLEQAGYFTRLQYQFQWQNAGYATFADFLARFPSKKRQKILRERKEAHRYRIEVVEGPSPELMRALYAFYVDTCSKFAHWGARYLNQAFFEHLGAAWGHRLVAALAWEGDALVGGTLNVVKGDRMYGRYWGASGERPFLHFELCYYATIEWCIARGLSAFEPGHGGEHKYARGFEPVLTRSSHRLGHPALHGGLADWTAQEREWVTQEAAALTAASPLRPPIGQGLPPR